MRLLLSTFLACWVATIPACDQQAGSPPPATSENQTVPADPAPIDPRTVGSIVGTVRLDGRPQRRLITPPDAYCAAQNPKGLVMDAFVLGAGQTLADVYIQVKSGLGNRRFPTPTKPVVLDQIKCVYVPHVVALMTAQPLVARNGDDTMHNVHGLPVRSPEFNKGQGVKGMENTFRFDVPETGIPVQCDVHPWMSAWVHVSSHPFFAVTGIDGQYSIRGLPPGDYEIAAWHERFPKAPRVAKVTVVTGQAATVDFTFEVTRK